MYSQFMMHGQKNIKLFQFLLLHTVHNETSNCLLYVQVTVHRDKLRTKQPTRCIIYPKFILS